MNQKKIIKLFLILSILIVVFNDFILKDITEKFDLGDELGSVLSNLSLAYISSYIFYILVVELKEKKDKKNVLRLVYELTDDLISNGYSPITEVMEALEVPLKDYKKNTMTREEFFTWCEKCDVKYVPKNKFFGNYPNNHRSAYITEFIYNSSVYHANKNIDKIFEFMPYLDTDFIALLNQLRYSIFFKRDAYSLTQISSLTNIPNKMIGRIDSMYDYIEIIHKIEKYNNKYHLKYK